MELSESVRRGLRLLAEPSVFDRTGFQVLVEVSCRSLLSSHGDPSVLDHPDLRRIDQIRVKQSHTAATTFMLEAVRHGADNSTLSSCLEDLSFSTERIEIITSAYQRHKRDLERLLMSVGSCPPQVHDVSWRLQHHIKDAHLDRVNEPFYDVSLKSENRGVPEEIHFTCSVEQLQDLLAKLKDAAKSVERASQM